MATFTNLDTIQRPSTGLVAPASWGDAVNDNCNVLNATILSYSGAAHKWDAGASLQFNTATFTAAALGTAIVFPVAYTTWSLVVCSSLATTNAQINCSATTATGFKAWVWAAGVQVTSGSYTLTYIAIGI